MNTKNRNNQLRIKTQGRGCLGKSTLNCRHAALKSSELRSRLADKLSQELAGEVSPVFARQAANEAEALAWSTPYPLLFLPVLLEEKLHAARQWSEHQREILGRQKILSLAA